jgi:hypothetical protein
MKTFVHREITGELNSRNAFNIRDEVKIANSMLRVIFDSGRAYVTRG